MIRRWAPVVVVLLLLVVYARTLEAPFVWDDRHLVLESLPRLQSQPLSDYFTRPFWDNVEDGDSRVYFRPLTVLSLALDYHLYGENSTGFHLTNLLAHCVNTWLLFALLRRHEVSSGTAGLLAALWGLHPRLTEAAAWVSGRTDVLATMGILAALVTYRPGSRARLMLAGGFTLLALLAKEVALAGVVSLVLLVLLDAPREGSPPRINLRQLGSIMAPLGIAFFGYCLLRTLGLQGSTPEVTELTAGGRFLVVIAAIGHYTQMLLVPWQPELQIGDPKNVNTGFIALGALVAITLLATGARLRRTFSASHPYARLYAIGAALFAVGFGLVLHIIPISISVIAADRFLYVPLAGLTLLIAPGVQRWLSRGWKAQAFPAALLASFVGATSVRIGEWCNELDLWTTTYFDTPKSVSLPGNELANIYYRAGLFSQAAQLFSVTSRSATNTHGVLSNYANARSQLGHYAEAQSLLAQLCAQNPSIPKFCLDTALVALHRLDFRTAEGFLEKALREAPTYQAALDVQNLVPRVRALVESPDYGSPQPDQRLASHFHVAFLAGQRPEALKLGEQLLSSHTADPALRREAAEYWARFGPPEELSRVFRGAASDVVDGDIQSAVASRIQTAEELLQKWPEIERHMHEHTPQ